MRRCTRTSAASSRCRTRFEEAVASFQDGAASSIRACRSPRKKLGQALAALGRGAEADAALEAWFGQDPRTAQVAIALDHLRAGRKDDAIATLKARLRINPDNVDALHTLAQAYWGDEKRQSDIEALLRRVTAARAGACARPGSCSASLLHEADRPEEAIACYQRARELEPGNAAAWSGLGADYAQIGDMEKSAAAYARVGRAAARACRAST